MNVSYPHNAPFAPINTAASPFHDAAVAKRFFESCGRAEKFAAGTTLFVENEKSTRTSIFTKPINAEIFNRPVVHRRYFLTAGAVELTAGGKMIDTIHAGEVFGEMSLVDQARRADCALLSINRDASIGLVNAEPAIGMAMMRCVADRMRHMNSLFA